jgi:hypothetical protein
MANTQSTVREKNGGALAQLLALEQPGGRTGALNDRHIREYTTEENQDIVRGCFF